MNLTRESVFKFAAGTFSALTAWGVYEWMLEAKNVTLLPILAVVIGVIGFTYSICQACPDTMLTVAMVILGVSCVMLLLGSLTLYHVMYLDYLFGSNNAQFCILLILSGFALAVLAWVIYRCVQWDQ